eukprot:jgi/Botrbrau1/1906/Bobra.0005s0021.1
MDVDAFIEGSAIVQASVEEMEDLFPSDESLDFRPLEEMYLTPTVLEAEEADIRRDMQPTDFRIRNGAMSLATWQSSLWEGGSSAPGGSKRHCCGSSPMDLTRHQDQLLQPFKKPAGPAAVANMFRSTTGNLFQPKKPIPSTLAGSGRLPAKRLGFQKKAQTMVLDVRTAIALQQKAVSKASPKTTSLSTPSSPAPSSLGPAQSSVPADVPSCRLDEARDRASKASPASPATWPSPAPSERPPGVSPRARPSPSTPEGQPGFSTGTRPSPREGTRFSSDRMPTPERGLPSPSTTVPMQAPDDELEEGEVEEGELPVHENKRPRLDGDGHGNSPGSVTHMGPGVLTEAPVSPPYNPGNSPDHQSNSSRPMYGEGPQPYNGHSYNGYQYEGPNYEGTQPRYGDYAEPETEEARYGYEGEGQGRRQESYGNYGAHWASSNHRDGWQDYDAPSRSRGGWQDLDAPPRARGGWQDLDAPPRARGAWRDLDAPSHSRGGWQDQGAPQRAPGSYCDWDAPENHRRSYYDLDLDDPVQEG